MTSIRTIAIACAVALTAALPLTGQTIEKSLGNYSYDDSGNVTSIGPDSEDLTNYYDYDSAGRLIRFSRRPSVTATPVITETYEYDAYGNQTRQTTNGVVTNLPASASTNRLTGAAYDAAGNVTNYEGVTYTFDPVGTLTQKSGSWGSAFYIYTADDERIGIEGPDATWRYTVRGLDGKVLREWAASTWNGSLRWVEDYVYRDGQLVAAVRPTAQGGVRHFHRDHLGTPRLITGPTARIYASHDYYPFGREITDPAQEVSAHGFDTPEPMKYTGHERDFAGSYAVPPLDYMHARYYSPSQGRFLSADPGKDWDTHQPQSWNMYSYVRNNPLNNTDPDGKWCVPCLVTVGVAAVRSAPVAMRGAQRAYIYLSNPANVQRAISAVQSIVGIGVTMSEGHYAPADENGDPLPLPTTHGNDTPDPAAEGRPHTQLGTRTKPTKGEAPYPQSRTWDGNSQGGRRIDHTDHNDPKTHPNPHQHRIDPNGKRHGAEPVPEIPPKNPKPPPPPKDPNHKLERD